jgi:hypothetical protein
MRAQKEAEKQARRYAQASREQQKEAKRALKEQQKAAGQRAAARPAIEDASTARHNVRCPNCLSLVRVTGGEDLHCPHCLARISPPSVATGPQATTEIPTHNIDSELAWKIVLQCADGTEALADPRYPTEQDARTAASKIKAVTVKTASGATAPKAVQGFYLIRAAKAARWQVLYDLGNGKETPGNDRYPTPEEANAAASAIQVLYIAGVPHNARGFELIDTDGGPWRIVCECTDGSTGLGYGRYETEATAARIASTLRTVTVSGEQRVIRRCRVVRDDTPLGRRTDPWFNEVAVELADLGLEERARNTGTILGGAPIQGDIALDGENFSVFITLFATSELTRQAELSLRAKPEVRKAMSQGLSTLRAVDRLLYGASGRGRVVDELLLQDVIVAVGLLSPPPATVDPEPPPAHGTASPSTRQESSIGEAAIAGADPLEQLRRLGELRDSGVLTQAEFEAKKAELLQRI